METVTQKRCKITSFNHRNCNVEGNNQVLRHRNLPKLASDSSSCSSGTTEEDSFMFELSSRSSKPAVRVPMKKLLAEEMTRETKLKRSPSVIARLMGLDGLPAQQSASKQQKRPSGNVQQKTTLVENAHRRGTYSGHRSHRKSSKEELEFKDVFEVIETSKAENNCYSSRRTLDYKLTEAEMAFIHQKFMDAKRLSTDEKLQDSREFHDALEVLDSNKDLLVKFLQQPDSMFAKHLHDLHGSSLQSHCGRVSAMKELDVRKYENSDLGLKLKREAPCRNHHKSHQKHHNVPFTHSLGRNAACGSHKASKSFSNGKVERADLPTRIVVLKPNLGKMLNATESSRSLHVFPSDCRKHNEHPNIKNREEESLRKDFTDGVGHPRYKTRESREISKEMRSRFNTTSRNFSSFGHRGYVRDESSSNVTGNESACESEVTSVNSRSSFDCSNRYRPSSSHSTESSVSREAKKRLSERWKMTHKSQEVEVVGRGNTLGEMLAIPDREVRPATSNAIVSEQRSSNKLSCNNGTTGLVEPLGISSMDGWKDGCVRNLSRSRSLPALSAPFANTKRSKHHETLRSDRYLMSKDAVKKERNKVVKGNFDTEDVLFHQNLRPSKKKYQSRRWKSMDSNHLLPEFYLHRNQVKTNSEENDHYEQSVVGSEINFVPGHMDNTEQLITISCETPENVVQMITISETPDPELSSHMLVKSDPSAGSIDNITPQEASDVPSEEGSVHMHHPVAELVAPANSKEADQPSPLSVLEAPFRDDMSSGSECFESLSADLHGLRMQLRLLKLESDVCTEGSMLISSDEDVSEVCISKQKGISEGSWESSYLIDVLINSGFNNADPDIFMATCHSPDCPVNPSVFEALEKKYCDNTSLPRSERRLLFNRINLALSEFYQQMMDLHPWVRPARTKMVPNWSKDGLKDGLCKLLASQEKKTNENTMEKVLARESQWLDLGDDLDVIGKDIEKLLIDELVLEVVKM